MRAKTSKNAIKYAKIKGLAGCLQICFGAPRGSIWEPRGVLKVPLGPLGRSFGVLKVALGNPGGRLCAINAAVGSRRAQRVAPVCKRCRKPLEISRSRDPRKRKNYLSGKR